MDLNLRFTFVCSFYALLYLLHVVGSATAHYISGDHMFHLTGNEFDFAHDMLRSHISSEVSINQAGNGKKPCPTYFEFLDYGVITEGCKGPRYPAKQCCEAFKKFACTYEKQINDASTDCATTMFTYINYYGGYPPGLFATECMEGKPQLNCGYTTAAVGLTSTSDHVGKSVSLNDVETHGVGNGNRVFLNDAVETSSNIGNDVFHEDYYGY